MPSLSFDPVAHAYDATRGYPAGIAEQIARAIEATANATAQTRFLEVGVGTGRIALPLASLGHDYTGVDISEKMVEQLEAKLLSDGWQEEQTQPWGTLPDEDATKASLVRRFTQLQKPEAGMRLVMADMTRLPLHDASFEVAVAVHVFHLVDGWQEAVSEVLRVLRPGGLFLHCEDEWIPEDSYNVGKEWGEIVHELGGEVKRPGSHDASVEVTRWLQERGLQPEETRPVSWETTVNVRRSLENITKRLWSSTWAVPDDLFATSVERLERWAHEQFGDKLDIERRQKHQFVISKTRV